MNISVDLTQFTDAITRMNKEVGFIPVVVYLIFCFSVIVAVLFGIGYCIKQCRQKGTINSKADRVVRRRKK